MVVVDVEKTSILKKTLKKTKGYLGEKQKDRDNNSPTGREGELKVSEIKRKINYRMSLYMSQ
tara:strand:- start:373 stop:558 length:186 start_codon:yes stop_codon:yes gene_type:complete